MRDSCKATICLIVAGFTMLGQAPAHAGWRDVMTHPKAARQPTAIGRSLAELQRVDSRIHIGYGDYAANTGPIDIYAWLSNARRLKYQGLRINSEEVSNYRRIGSRTYTVSTDARDLRLPNLASAPVGRPTSWKLNMVGSVAPDSRAAVHLYDVVKFDGALWVAGGMANRNAGLWRSTNAGKTWELALEVPPQSGFSNDVSRFYFIGLHRKKLYVQAYDHCGGSGCAHRRSRVFNGDRWKSGPDLLRNTGMGYAPVNFRGEMVFRTSERAFYPSSLYAFNGISVNDPLPWRQPVHDFAVAKDGFLYVLTADINPNDGVNDQHVLRTRDLETWECIFDAPRRNIARTIEVARVPNKNNRLRSKVFLGTTKSSLLTRWAKDRENCDGWW